MKTSTALLVPALAMALSLALGAGAQAGPAPAPWPEHLTWASILAVLLTRGAGPLSVDHAIAAFTAARPDPRRRVIGRPTPPRVPGRGLP